MTTTVVPALMRVSPAWVVRGGGIFLTPFLPAALYNAAYGSQTYNTPVARLGHRGVTCHGGKGRSTYSLLEILVEEGSHGVPGNDVYPIVEIAVNGPRNEV